MSEMQITSEVNPFEKYGLTFLASGSIFGPLRPPLTGLTPPISIDSQANAQSLSLEESRIKQLFTTPFTVLDELESVMDIVDGVFESVTGENYRDYSRVIFMENRDWNQFTAQLNSNADAEKTYDGIHFGGLIIMNSKSGDGIFPLIFHELGHSLYPFSGDRFTDELRAFFFQFVCVDTLLQYMNGFGLDVSYPTTPDEEQPSADHMKAYHSAAAAYSYKRTEHMYTEDDPNTGYKKRMLDLLALV